MYKSFLILLAITLASSQTITLYINNTQNNPFPNGNVNNAYSNFSQAFANELSILTSNEYVTLYFAPSSQPYIINNTNLTLTNVTWLFSSTVTPQSPQICSQYPTLIFDGALMYGYNVTVATDAINVIFTTNVSSGIILQSTSSVTVNVESTCFTGAASSNGSTIFDVRNANTYSLIFYIVNVTATQGQFTSQIIRLTAKDTGMVQSSFKHFYVVLDCPLIYPLIELTGGEHAIGYTLTTFALWTITGTLGKFDSNTTLVALQNMEGAMITNISITGFTAIDKKKIGDMTFFQIFNISVVTVNSTQISNVQCTQCTFVQLKSAVSLDKKNHPLQAYIQNVNIAHTTEMVILNNQESLLLLDVGGITVTQSHFTNLFIIVNEIWGKVVNKNLELYFIDISVSTSTFSQSFLEFQEKDLRAPDFVPLDPYYLIVLSQSTFQNNTFKNTAFHLQTAILVSNCTFTKNVWDNAQTFYTYKHPISSIFMVNTIFQGEHYHGGSIIESPGPATDAKFSNKSELIYRFVILQNNTFLNLASDGSSYLINTGTPFFISSNNIFQNVNLTKGGNFMNIQGLSISFAGHDEANLKLEQTIFAPIPNFYQTFLAIRKALPNCFKSCYFSAVVNTTFSVITYDKRESGDIFALARGLNSTTQFLFESNIFLGVTSNIPFVTVSDTTGSFIFTSNILNNITVRAFMEVSIANMAFIFNKNTINQLNTGRVININLQQTLVPSLFLIPIVLDSNTLTSSQFSGFYELTSASQQNITISNTIIRNSALQWSSSLSTLYGISVQLTQTQVQNFITIVNTTFSSVSACDYIPGHGYYPSLQNVFIQAVGYADSEIVIANTSFTNVVSNATFTSVMIAKGGLVTISGLSTNNINIMRGTNFGYYIYASHLTMNTVELLSNNITSASIYTGQMGLIFFSNNHFLIEHRNTFNFQNIYVQDWLVNSPMFYFQDKDMNIHVNGMTVLTSYQPFFIAAKQSNLTFISVIFIGASTPFLTYYPVDNALAQLNVTNFSEVFLSTMLGPVGFFTFNFANQYVAISMNNVSTQKLGLIKCDNVMGFMEFQNITLNQQDPSTNMAGLFLLSGNSHDFIFRNIKVYNAFSVYNNQSIIVLGNNQSTNIFELSGATLYNSSVAALLDTTKSNSDVSMQNIVMSGCSLNLVQIKSFSTKPSSTIILQNVIVVNHQSAFIDIYGTKEVLLENLIVAFSNTSYSSGIFSDAKTVFAMSKVSIVSNILNNYDKGFIGLAGVGVDLDTIAYVGNNQPIELYVTFSRIVNSIFANNQSPFRRGGALALEKTHFNMSNCQFANNLAETGSSVYIMSTPQYNNYLFINNTFTNETQTMYGGPLSTPGWYVDANFSYVNNFSYLSEYMIFNLTKIKSGYAYANYNLTNASMAFMNNSQININLTSYFNATVTDLGDLEIEINFNNQPKILDVTTNGGTIIINGNDIPITGVNPPNNLSIDISSGFTTFTVNIYIYYRSCLIGEFVNPKTLLCEICPEGTISYGVNSTCEICPFGFECLGGASQLVTPGFWFDNVTNQSLPCLRDGVNRCPGGVGFNTSCMTGYTGPLCQTCDYANGFTVGSQQTCVPCSGGFITFVEFAFKLLASFGFEIMYIVFSYRAIKISGRTYSMSENSLVQKAKALEDESLSIQIKIFTNYLQFSYIIATYLTANYYQSAFGLIESISFFLSVAANPSLMDFSSAECFFTMVGVAPSNLPFALAKFSLVLPLLKIVILLLTVFVLWATGKIDQPKALIASIIFSFMILEQPGAIQNMTQLLDCNIGYISGYLELFSIIQCSNPTYTTFASEVMVPALIFWAFGVPLTLWLILFFNRKNTEPEIRALTGTIVSSYEKQAYYWSLITMIMKLFLLLVFGVLADVQTAMSITFVVMVMFYYLFVTVQPYEYREMVSHEGVSLIALSVTLYFFDVASESYYSFLQGLLVVVIILVNVGVFLQHIWRAMTKYERLTKVKNEDDPDKVFGLNEKLLNKLDESERKSFILERSQDSIERRSSFTAEKRQDNSYVL